MEKESLFTFSDKQVMVNATSVISTKVIDWTENSGFEANHRPLFLVVTVNVVPTGTSIVVKGYRHTTATVNSGKLLFTGEIVTVANMSANPRATGAKHILYAGILPPRCDRDASETDQSEYFGLYYTCAGDCSDGYVDAYLAYESPLIHTTQVNVSNI